MPKITEMYAFVSIDNDDPDDEGVIGIQTPMGGWMPAVGADMARVDSLRPQIAEMMGDQPWKILAFKTIEVLHEHDASRCCVECKTHTMPHKRCVLR